MERRRRKKKTPKEYRQLTLDEILKIHATAKSSFTNGVFLHSKYVSNYYERGKVISKITNQPEVYEYNNGYNMRGIGPVNGERFNGIIYSTFFSPPTSASSLATILDNTVDARRYVEDRRLGWWIPFQGRNVDTEVKELFKRVFKGILVVLVVVAACMVYTIIT
ncbi:hypothetical protein MKW98_032573, partial [Papaver atlanticum]